jgi:flavodoxin
MKVFISYLSKTGITRRYAAEMDSYLRGEGFGTEFKSVFDAGPEMVESADVILLGAWCHGLFVVLQHPDRDWVKFARRLPDLSAKKVALFTTYKLATGGMFRRMKKHLKLAGGQQVEIFRSRDGSLSEADRHRLLDWLKAE